MIKQNIGGTGWCSKEDNGICVDILILKLIYDPISYIFKLMFLENI